MRDFCNKHRKWTACLAILLVAALIVVIVRASEPPLPKTEAAPPAESEVTFDMEKNRAYTSEDGVVVIPASSLPINVVPAVMESPATPLNSSANTMHNAAPAPSFAPSAPPVKKGGNYTMPAAAQMGDGSVGRLSVPKLSLSVSVYETDDEMEAMTHGLAHFKTTSAWDGNIGVCGHNVNFDLTDGYFKNLHTLVPGDTISYQTALGGRSYAVETVAEIEETDWSYLGRTEDNRITLITCISGKPRSRLVVQAVAI